MYDTTEDIVSRAKEAVDTLRTYLTEVSEKSGVSLYIKGYEFIGDVTVITCSSQLSEEECTRAFRVSYAPEIYYAKSCINIDQRSYNGVTKGVYKIFLNTSSIRDKKIVDLWRAQFGIAMDEYLS